MITLARMRTVPETVAYFKAQDPGSYVNEWWLRGLIQSGAIPYHRAGKRFLLNLDALETYLDNPPVVHEEIPTYGKIRRISGR